MTTTIVLALTAIVGAAVFIHQYLFDRDLRMLEPGIGGLAVCSIIGCDTILRGWCFVDEADAKHRRFCEGCATSLESEGWRFHTESVFG